MSRPSAPTLLQPGPHRRTSPGRIILSALVRTVVVMTPAAVLAIWSLEAAVLGLTTGSVVVLVWTYRKPWTVCWLSALPPALAAGLSIPAQMVIPLPEIEQTLLLGVGLGGLLGLTASIRHRLDWKHARYTASAAWGPVLVWGFALLASQVGAFSRDVDLARYGVAGASLGASLQTVFFGVLILRTRRNGPQGPMVARKRRSRRVHQGREGTAGLLLLTTLWPAAGMALGMVTPPPGHGEQEDHDVELSRVLAGEVRGLSVRLSGGEGYASGRLIAHFTNETGRTFRVGVLGGSLFSPRNSVDAPVLQSSSYHVLVAPQGSSAQQVNARVLEGYEPVGECSPRVTRAPSGGGAFVGVQCPLPSHLYGMEPAAEGAPGEPWAPSPDPEPDPDPWAPPLVPEGYVPGHLLAEGGEEAGVLAGALALLASLLGSIGVALGRVPGLPPGTRPAPEAIGDEPEASGSSPAGAPHRPPDVDRVLEAIRRRHIAWLASDGKLPETISGQAPLSPWGGDGYRIMREQREHVDRSVQRLRRPGDLYDPSLVKQEEMEEYHRYEVMRRGNAAGRFVRAVTAGAGDVASDPKPGIVSVVSGALHAFWDAVGPDPTSIPEGMVDPMGEYRELVEAWRESQSFSRWLRTGTPREPSDIRALIESLKDERHAEQMDHIGDEAYFADGYPRWEEELRRLRALEEWLGRAGGSP